MPTKPRKKPAGVRAWGYRHKGSGKLHSSAVAMKKAAEFSAGVAYEIVPVLITEQPARKKRGSS